MLEFEKKIMLSNREFECIMELYPNFKRRIQTNFYYDTSNLDMHKNGITCRIREMEGYYENTIKEHSNVFSECSVENICHRGTGYDDIFFRKMGLSFQGCLRTERFMCKLQHVKIILDKNTYFNIIDYEMEIEYTIEFEHDAYLVLSNIASKLYALSVVSDIREFCDRNHQAKGKSSRFFSQKTQEVCENI